MLRTAQSLAIISLVSVILFDVGVVQGIIGPYAQPAIASTMTTYTIVQGTIVLLCIITGVLALVPAVERHQSRWVITLLLTLLVGCYGPYGASTLWARIIDFYYRSGTKPPAVLAASSPLFHAFSGSIIPAIVAVVALIYTLRANHGAAPTANA